MPRLGFSLPLRIFSAVDLPMPFVPTRPRTCPGRGMGRRCSLKLFGPYRCVVSFSRFFGRLMICTASNGHFLTQMPHPMHSSSEMYAIFELPLTSMHSLPIFTTGHAFLHSCLHFFGRHRSALTIAMRSSRSAADSSPFFFDGGIASESAKTTRRTGRSDGPRRATRGLTKTERCAPQKTHRQGLRVIPSRAGEIPRREGRRRRGCLPIRKR